MARQRAKQLNRGAQAAICIYEVSFVKVHLTRVLLLVVLVEQRHILGEELRLEHPLAAVFV